MIISGQCYQVPFWNIAYVYSVLCLLNGVEKLDIDFDILLKTCYWFDTFGYLVYTCVKFLLHEYIFIYINGSTFIDQMLRYV